MLQRPLQVVNHRQPASGGPGPLLLSCPDQVLRASLAEVVQLGCGTPPALFQLGNPCSGLLQHIGLGHGAVGLGALRLGLSMVAPLRLLLRLNTIALGGLGLGHDQREVNSASITSSESSPPDSRGELSVGPADAPAVAPARAEAARDCRS